jgi:hypothetical protein
MVRDAFGWGPRKMHAYLRPQALSLPSSRTVAAILKRHGRVDPPAPPPPPLQRFERGRPNELWQCDFKGFLEVARQRVYPFTVLDDHSRYLLDEEAGKRQDAVLQDGRKTDHPARGAQLLPDVKQQAVMGVFG